MSQYARSKARDVREADACGVLLLQDAGELLLGGLSSLRALQVVQRPGLGEHGPGAGQLYLQFLDSSPAR